MADGIVLTGIRELQANLKGLSKKVRDKFADELYQEGLRIMELSQKRVPVGTTALKESGRVTKPTVTSGDVSITLSYGGSTPVTTRTGLQVVNYAIPVHERLGVHHPVGQAKFLESVMNEEAPFILRNIAENMEDTGF